MKEIIYRITAGPFGVSVKERKILKENPKIIELEGDHFTLLKKVKLDQTEEGIFLDTFQMYTLNITQEKIEEVRAFAKERWIGLRLKARNALNMISKDAEYHKLRGDDE